MSGFVKRIKGKNLRRKDEMKRVKKSSKNNLDVTLLKKGLDTRLRNDTSTEKDLCMIKRDVTSSEVIRNVESGKNKRKLFSRNKSPHDKDKNIYTPPDSGEKESSAKLHRNIIRQKLALKRLKKGLVMLSPKAEAKIYKLKKSLHKRGLSEQEIKQIIRQKRRSEEIKFRGSAGNSCDVCFRCRKPGHRFAECKLIAQDTDQGAGVCFSCGSTEHILKNCPNRRRKLELPFAKCFVCSQLGHLSGQCPSNPKGAFPKGGKCNLCSSINHLKRDCPQLNKSVESDFTVKVSRIEVSADALDYD